MRKPRITRRQRLFSLFLICSFFGLLLTVMAFSVVIYVLGRAGRLGESELSTLQGTLPLMLGAMLTMALGTVLAGILVRIPLKSINTLMDGLNSLASGHFEQRVELGESRMMRELSDSFNTLAQELQNTEMLRSDFINNFSHEFKTPITSIAGFAARLQRPDVPEEKKREYVDVIVQESRRLSALSSNILMLSHYENQDAVTGREEYSLDEQLRLCVLAMQDAWSAKNLEIEADLQPLTIRANADMLAQVWNNLLSNAVKFTPEGGRLTLRCFREAGRTVVVVSDTGVGMTEETMRHIFDKFYQGDTSHKLAGNGLGLPIVKRIVDLCGGEIQVTSTPGRGTQFRVSLPGDGGTLGRRLF